MIASVRSAAQGLRFRPVVSGVSHRTDVGTHPSRGCGTRPTWLAVRTNCQVVRETSARSRQIGAVRLKTFRQAVAATPKVSVVALASTANGASNW